MVVWRRSWRGCGDEEGERRRSVGMLKEELGRAPGVG